MPFVVAPLSYVEYSGTVRANTNGTTAGLVFGYHDSNNFLYAGIVAGSNQVVIGHRGGGVFITDFVSSKVTTAANTDYNMMVALDKNNVSVVLNGTTIASYSYNFLPNQGRIGLFTSGGAGSFDNLLVRGDDVTFATTPQLLTAASVPSIANSATIAGSQLAPIVDAAYANWARALGTSAAALKSKVNLSFAVADLGDSTLAELAGNSVIIDDNAAGNGWYVDATPKTSTEFRRKAGILVARTAAAAQGVDLLTTVMHEIGHALGLSHSAVESSLMNDTLGIGTRKLPGRYAASVLSLLIK